MENKCRIEFNENGLEIEGPCASGLLSTFKNIYQASKETNSEISAYACVNPISGDVEKVILGNVGTPINTTLPFSRVCPIEQRQVTIHTHPTSGLAKFSETDAQTLTKRLNTGIDDVSCVVGEEESLCLTRALLKKDST